MVSRYWCRHDTCIKYYDTQLTYILGRHLEHVIPLNMNNAEWKRASYMYGDIRRKSVRLKWLQWIDDGIDDMTVCFCRHKYIIFNKVYQCHIISILGLNNQ